MQPVALNTISPDTGLNIKGVTAALPSYSYTYTEPGTYTVTFIVAGGNYQGQSAPAPYEVTFTVIDPIEEPVRKFSQARPSARKAGFFTISGCISAIFPVTLEVKLNL